MFPGETARCRRRNYVITSLPMALSPQHTGANVSRLLIIAILLILALGAVLRVYKLGSESIWLDEAFTIQITHGSLSSIVEETSKDVHPPLYYFVFHYWLELFGDSEFASRLLSVLLGVLAILAMYKLAALMFDRTMGLFAALLLALSPFHIEFSQEARMYTMLTLLTLLSMYFLTRMLAEKPGRVALAGYVISSALMMYTHVYSLFIIAAQNLFVFSLVFLSRDTFRRIWKRWLIAQATLAVLFIPWLSVLMQQVSRVQKGFWIPRLPATALVDTLFTFAGSRHLALIFFPLAAVAIFVGLRGRGRPEKAALDERTSNELSGRLKTYLLLLWLICPVVFPFVISQVSSPIFLPKYTIPASLAFLILVTRGLVSVRFHQLQMALMLLIMGFSIVALRGYYATTRKDAWRDVVAGFTKLAKPNDLVLFNQQSGQSPFDYYARRSDLIEKPFPDYHSELRIDNIAELIKPLVDGQDRVWLVLSHQGVLTPLIPEQLKQWYTVTVHRIDPGVETYLFEKR
ncbi:MAG: mannosyltransferase [Acidobacteriota bacterium]|nr:mannosyltransferase [Acidobacteriota bacterium]